MLKHARIAVLTLVVPIALAGCKSPTAESRISEANEFLKHDQFQKAAETVEPVVKDQPGNWQAQLALGRGLLGQGQLEAARRSLERAHTLKPTSDEAVFALATCMVKQNDAASAYQLLRGFGKEFRSWRAYMQLSTLAEQVGDADTALQAADDAIKVADPLPDQRAAVEPYLRAADVCFHFGREEQGVRRLRQAYGLNPDDPRTAQALRDHNVAPSKAIILPPGV